MTDRKYRQQGYQDRGGAGGGSARGGGGFLDDRPQRLEGAPKGRGADPHRDEVFRCKGCGEKADPEISMTATCKKCGAALHACVQCRHFDTASPYQCRKPITVAIPAKSRENSCLLFEATISMDLKGRTASASPSAPDSARGAFDRLFGKK